MRELYVYICSPYKGEWMHDEQSNPFKLRNESYARAIANAVFECDAENRVQDIVCPHLYYPQFDTLSRSRGLQIALQRLELCNLMIVGRAFGVSEGMKAEIALAKELGLEIAHIESVHSVKDIFRCATIFT